VKKRKIACLLLCLLMLVMATGCASTKTTTSQPKDTSANTSQNSPGSNGSVAGNQSEKKSPDIFGKVKSINGNEVTISLAQMPQRNEPASGSGKSGTTPPDNTASGNTAPTAPSGTPPGNDTGKAPKQGGMPDLQLTGETKTITLPADIKIVAGGGGNAGQNDKEIKLTDVKVDDIMQIYYKAGETGEIRTVESIRVMQAATTK